MARAKSAPRVKGPYSERGGTRFRIRVCNETGQNDMYFLSLKEAQEAKRQAERELPRGSVLVPTLEAADHTRRIGEQMKRVPQSPSAAFSKPAVRHILQP